MRDNPLDAALNKPKELRWLAGAIKTPPFSEAARLEAGEFLRDLQDGELLSLPISRPMPSIGAGCHELRIRDNDHYWRVVYYIGVYHIAILSVFAKKTRATPKDIILKCRRALRGFQEQEKTLE